MLGAVPSICSLVAGVLQLDREAHVDAALEAPSVCDSLLVPALSVSSSCSDQLTAVLSLGVSLVMCL